MKRLGTKLTQGINGEAAALSGRMDRALALVGAEGEPCPYPQHRATDWRLSSAHPPVCGVCHPPARGLDVEMVGA